MWMRTGFGVGERSRSRFLRRADNERERDRDLDLERERSRSFAFSAERRFSLFASPASFSELRRERSFDFGRSFGTFDVAFDPLRLLLRERERAPRLSPRRWSLLDEDDELELDDDELDELERDPELCDDELLSDELMWIFKMKQKRIKLNDNVIEIVSQFT